MSGSKAVVMGEYRPAFSPPPPECCENVLFGTAPNHACHVFVGLFGENSGPQLSALLFGYKMDTIEEYYGSVRRLECHLNI